MTITEVLSSGLVEEAEEEVGRKEDEGGGGQ